MAREQIKEFVLESREKGNSYQSIANDMLDKFGVDMTRQGVHLMYKRAIENDMASNNKTSNDKVITFITNMKAIDVSDSNIKKLLADKGVELTLYKIRRLRNENKNIIEEIERCNLDIVKDMLFHGKNIKDIRKELSYCGMEPNKNVLANLAMNALAESIENMEIKTIKNTLNATIKDEDTYNLIRDAEIKVAISSKRGKIQDIKDSEKDNIERTVYLKDIKKKYNQE